MKFKSVLSSTTTQAIRDLAKFLQDFDGNPHLLSHDEITLLISRFDQCESARVVELGRSPEGRPIHMIHVFNPWPGRKAIDVWNLDPHPRDERWILTDRLIDIARRVVDPSLSKGRETFALISSPDDHAKVMDLEARMSTNKWISRLEPWERITRNYSVGSQSGWSLRPIYAGVERPSSGFEAVIEMLGIAFRRSKSGFFRKVVSMFGSGHNARVNEKTILLLGGRHAKAVGIHTEGRLAEVDEDVTQVGVDDPYAKPYEDTKGSLTIDMAHTRRLNDESAYVWYSDVEAAAIMAGGRPDITGRVNQEMTIGEFEIPEIVLQVKERFTALSENEILAEIRKLQEVVGGAALVVQQALDVASQISYESATLKYRLDLVLGDGTAPFGVKPRAFDASGSKQHLLDKLLVQSKNVVFGHRRIVTFLLALDEELETGDMDGVDLLSAQNAFDDLDAYRVLLKDNVKDVCDMHQRDPRTMLKVVNTAVTAALEMSRELNAPETLGISLSP